MLLLLIIITQVMFDQKDGSSKVAGSNPGADSARWFSGEWGAMEFIKSAPDFFVIT